MQVKVPTKVRIVGCLLLSFALRGGPGAPAVCFAQDSKPFYDARLALHATKLSDSEEKLLQGKVVSAARNNWHEQEEDQACEEGIQPFAIDITRGSFTKPESDQKAILYRYCSTGHNTALNGIAVIENDRVVSHIAYEGGWDNAIGSLPDINGNGRSEILVASGGTNQGETWGSVSILELSDSIVVTKFGHTTTYSDDCGKGGKTCKSEAYRLSVKPGKTPVFYREAFVGKGAGNGAASWKKSEALKPISLEEDEIEYQFIR